jgi:hypothetical protein
VHGLTQIEGYSQLAWLHRETLIDTCTPAMYAPTQIQFLSKGVESKEGVYLGSVIFRFLIKQGPSRKSCALFMDTSLIRKRPPPRTAIRA